MAKGKEPEIGIVTAKVCRCRCGHVWLPRIREEDGSFERPAVCPKCKDPRWDKPKRN